MPGAERRACLAGRFRNLSEPAVDREAGLELVAWDNRSSKSGQLSAFLQALCGRTSAGGTGSPVRRQLDRREPRRRGRGHQPDLERRGPEREHRQQRDRHTADLRPELTGRLPDQQPPKIPRHDNLHRTGWEPHPPAEIRR
jgi:hypothetical protein